MSSLSFSSPLQPYHINISDPMHTLHCNCPTSDQNCSTHGLHSSMGIISMTPSASPPLSNVISLIKQVTMSIVISLIKPDRNLDLSSTLREVAL
ncbi:hypothetical protein VNO80_28448 [Phaseolus coccineus]|uniref:Uncharacterized protein n=1 Tax=Phaseolus coccineus TaxID=3886 RepID=A0AAN9L9L8_PHACN